ncbi:MAG: carboxypeptidase regulatory-like domain-containing protein, partial [Arenicella sp.]|nr:carboxypeptidase regulatory-like domain-containing protein [Arenicella sp.]
QAGASESLSGQTSQTDVNGDYSFDFVPLGNYTVEASLLNGDIGRASASVLSVDEVVTSNVQLNGLGNVIVTVTDAAGNTVPDVQVTINTGSPFGRSYQATTNASGQANIVDILAGAISVTAFDPIDRLGGMLNTSLLVGETANIVVSLEPAGDIFGTVFMADGFTPAANISITVSPSGSRVTTAADGQYRFNMLPLARGPYNLSARDSNGILRGSENGIVLSSDGEQIQRDITLGGVGMLSGVVFNPGGTIAPNAIVVLNSSVSGARDVTTRSSSEGEYSFTGVPEGNFQVEASIVAQRFAKIESGVIEFDGDNKVIDITMLENQLPGSISTVANLFDANNFSYAVQRDGSVQDGTRNVFAGDGDVFRGEGRLDLFRDGVVFPFFNLEQSNVSFAQAGREVIISGASGSGVIVNRRVYVPLDGYFVRHIETFENPSTEPITIDVRIDTHFRIVTYNRGLDTPTLDDNVVIRVPVGVVSTSSGDSFLNVGSAASQDNWAVFDDDRDIDPFLSNNLPAIAYSFGDTAGSVRASNIEFLSGTSGQHNRMRVEWQSLEIQPQQLVSIMYFTSEQTDRQAAIASAQRLSSLSPEAISGLSANQRANIINYSLPVDGVSLVSPLPSLLSAVSGSVFEADNLTTVADSNVTLQSDHPLFRRLLKTNSNSVGDFSYVGLLSNGSSVAIPEGDYSVFAKHPVSLTDSADVAGAISAGVGQSNIVFNNTGILRGTVRRFDGVVASFGSIELMGDSLPRTLTTVIPEDGQYRFTGLPVGNYTVIATLPNPDGTGIAGSASVQIQNATETIRDITLVEVGGITGQVLTAGGEPVVGILVRLSSDDFTRQVRTDTGGVFRFLDTPVDNYQVTVDDPITGETISAPVDVVDNQLVSQNLILTATATVFLDATFEDGTPARGALVQIQSDIIGTNFRSAGTVRTDGSAIINNVPLGAFVLRVVNQNNTNVATSVNGQVTLHGQQIPIVAVVSIDFPPVVSLLSPTDGQQIVKGETTLVSVAVNDDFGIRRVEFLRNGALVTIDSTAPYQSVLLVDDDLQGQSNIEFSVRVIDDAGNIVERSVTVTALEDTIPPVISNVSPIDGLVQIEGLNLFYAATVTDNAGVEQVEFLIDGNLVKVDTSAPYNGNFTVPSNYADAGDASLAFEVRGRDFSGNQTVVMRSVLITPDLPPEISIIEAPVDGASVIEGTNLSIRVSANDDVQVTQVELLVNGEVVQTRFNSPYSFSFITPLLDSITNPVPILLRATDSQGQTTQTTPQTIVVIRDDPPTVDLTAPLVDAQIVEGSLVTLSATASDDVGIARVDFFEGASLLGSDATAPYELTQRLASGTNGSIVSYTAVAVDTLAQEAQSSVNIIRLDDLVPPTVTITAPQDGAIITVGPSDVAIVIDTSGSTGNGSGADIDGDGIFDNILKAEIFAAKALLDFLNPETTNVAVIDFSSSAILVQSLTNDFAAVNTALDQILASGPGGGTNFNSAMNVATTELAGLNSRSFATPVQLFLSDGSASVPTSEIQRAADGAIIVNSFAVGSGANISALQQISDGTGGAATPVPDASQIVDILPSTVLFGIDTLVSIADAQDDIAVRDVSFTVASDDGSISDAGSDDSAPYTQASGLPTIENQVEITINATATDFGDNTANATPISVTLLPAENSPRLTRLEPEFAISGQLVTVLGQFLVSANSGEPSTADPAVPATTVVFYNGVEITPDFVNKITIRFILPAGSASGEVFALANGVQTNSLTILIDDDQDGLSNEEELALGTNPLLADTDGDGLSDGDEVNIHGTDPLSVDTDGDGLPDGVEVDNSLDPNDPADAVADADGDGLSNAEEFNLGTGINDSDSDNDGLNDGDEVNVHGTDPLDRDTDNDGLDDGVEVNQLNSNPLSSDSDGDGMDDRFEFDNGLNLIDASDRDGDADNDGLTNFEEFTLNTGVNNPDSDGDGLSDGEEVNVIGSNPLDADTDNDGLDDGVDDDPLVADATLPIVTLLEPAANADIVRGSLINLSANAIDNGAVTVVRFLVNDIIIGSDVSEPYGISSYRVPVVGVDFTIEVQAEDTNGNIGSSTAITFALIDDPNTTVIGRVIDQAAQPVIGAAIEVAGLTTVTLADGSFTIAGVPTVEAALQVNAELTPLLGRSAEVVPVQAGVTDVGAIILREQVARSGSVGYYSLTSNQGVSAQIEPIVAAGLDPVLLTNLATDDLDQLSILFIQNPSNSASYSSTYTSNLARIFSFIETGGVVVFHDRAVSSNTSSVMPGDPATFVRSVVGGTTIITSDEAFLNGPGGVLNASVVSDNSFGSHGYAQQSSLPVGTIGLLSQSDTTRWHTFAIPHGAGYMVYSALPLDFYLTRTEPVRSIYAPNILSYAAQLVPNVFDIDGDGLSDEDEVNVYGTNMLVADTDGDGLPDGFEVDNGLDPLDPLDGALDLDGDGLTNLQEFTLGTLINDPDTDNDQLSDGDEVNIHGTDPLDADTDDDGLSDGFEVANGFDPLQPGEGELDTDGDGLINSQEVAIGTDPLNPDTDGDGMPDGYEFNNGLDPLSPDDAALDSDGDGLTNLQEFNAGTNPFRSDTDLDGLSDGDEVNNFGTDPLVEDTDGDGLRDGDEVFIFSTDPLKADSDGDGMPDGYEVNNGLDPNDVADANLDLDGDGLSNLDEFNLGTSPSNTDSDGDGLQDGEEVNVTLTDPSNPDTDGDGLLDGFEVNNGFNPLLTGEEGQDPDGDGLTNLQEQEQGSDPNLVDTDGDGTGDLADVAPNDPAITTADIMLIDGTESESPFSIDQHLSAVSAIGLQASSWNTTDAGLPSRLLMSKHQLVVWMGGEFAGLDFRQEVFTQNYLNGGGCYLLSAQDYHFNVGFTPFMENFLGLLSVQDDSFSGDGGDVIAEGVGPLYPLPKAYTLSFPFNNYADYLVTGLATPLMLDTILEVSEVVATHYDSGVFNATFLGFPLE